MFYQSPASSKAIVAIFHRDFAPYGQGVDEYTYCHVGLGVNAVQTAKVLRKQNIICDIHPVETAEDIISKLLTLYFTVRPTHVVIEAPWVDIATIQALLTAYPKVHFIVRAHSQIGFLQVEPRALGILRDLIPLAEGSLNLTVASNTRRLQAFLENTYTGRVLYLPNLYDLERVVRKSDVTHTHRMLRIGSFGALRPLKNHTTAAAAALLIARRRGTDLEFYVNSGRQENAGASNVLSTLKIMFQGLKWATLVEEPWKPFPEFRRTVAFMDLCLQVSFSETFNITTADAIAEGVPSVVSSSIEWAPEGWKVDADDANDIARVGSYLLSDTHGAEEGLAALTSYVSAGVADWVNYLDSNPT